MPRLANEPHKEVDEPPGRPNNLKPDKEASDTDAVDVRSRECACEDAQRYSQNNDLQARSTKSVHVQQMERARITEGFSISHMQGYLLQVATMLTTEHGQAFGRDVRVDCRWSCWSPQ